MTTWIPIMNFFPFKQAKYGIKVHKYCKITAESIRNLRQRCKTFCITVGKFAFSLFPSQEGGGWVLVPLGMGGEGTGYFLKIAKGGTAPPLLPWDGFEMYQITLGRIFSTSKWKCHKSGNKTQECH